MKYFSTFNIFKNKHKRFFVTLKNEEYEIISIIRNLPDNDVKQKIIDFIKSLNT